MRIHKAVGYGITGLGVNAKDGMTIDDPRINTNSVAFDHEDIDGYDDYSDTHFLAKLTEETQESIDNEDYDNESIELLTDKALLQCLIDDQTKLGRIQTHNALDGIIYAGEYGDPSTLLIVPAGMTGQWTRWDDSIDSFEMSLKALEGIQPEVPVIQELPFPPYPFAGWINARTGERLTRKEEIAMRTIQRIEDTISKNKNLNEEEISALLGPCERLSIQLGFKDYAEFSATVVPDIPLGVRYLAAWVGLFAIEDAWKDLRPMIYTYMS